ncbi:DUF1573 domain-containing protein [Pontibacter sp. G13]|uniref:DUF1573 domain-containing protein n=1 Tax=Pontibacter sp. G13 TaxID=3074898 RepID=UPI00288C0B83|nr:DUF1573 domain-containing protein [Pontibacter sp. G13]WNJ20106.1 DUF1573 domain-containing protein [Pontibacter sp. G13]
MKQLTVYLTAFLMVGVVAVSSVSAQTESDINVSKELKKVLKELPADAQMEVLEYAKRKQKALARLEERKAQQRAKLDAAVAEQQARTQQSVTTAQPKQGQQLNLNQDRTSNVTIPNPANAQTPARPPYLEEAESMTATTVEWGETMHKFGKVVTGTKVNHTFKFKNTGDQPLKLTRVKASCGCTTPKWTKEEIAPGEEGIIEVTFNTSGKSGPQRKTVTVTGNFEPINMVLRIQGEVTPKAPASTN